MERGRKGEREEKISFKINETELGPHPQHTCSMTFDNSNLPHSQFQHLWGIDHAYLAVSVMTKDNVD